MKPTKHLILPVALIAAVAILSGCALFRDSIEFWESSEFALGPNTRWTSLRYGQWDLLMGAGIYMELFLDEHRIRFDRYDSYSHEREPIVHQDRIATEDEWRWISSQLEQSKFDKWKTDYSAEVYDGWAWELTFFDGTNIVGQASGSNATPKRFEKLRSIVRSLDIRTADRASETNGAPIWETCFEILGLECPSIPSNVTMLAKSGDFALLSGETEEDAVFNAKAKPSRISLFLRRRSNDHDDEWKRIIPHQHPQRVRVRKQLQNEPDWIALELSFSFRVKAASFSSDGCHIWLVCGPLQYDEETFFVCSYDLKEGVLNVLTDQEDSFPECPDGTICVKNQKTLLYDENGESLGTAWYDEWIKPDGTVARKSEPRQKPFP